MAASDDDASRCLLLALSHDELGVIFDGLADPLQPVVAFALSSTCLGLRTPLLTALEALWQRHARAKALGWKAGILKTGRHGSALNRVALSCADLRDAEELDWRDRGLTTDDMATLGLILPWMPRLKTLDLFSNGVVAGMHALFEGLGHGAAPSLCYLNCAESDFGPAAAETLAAALRRGAMPKLEELYLGENGITNESVAILAPVLKKLAALKLVDLGMNDIADEGVASLLDNLGKDDFKTLKGLYLDGNILSDKSCATVVAALKAGALPAIEALCHPEYDDVFSEYASAEACEAVDAALEQRSQQH